MKKRVFSIMGLSFLLAAFALAVVPAQAQNVEQKIQALEQELSQLKDQQIELKKEATAAAAAMPSFSYRPGNGMTIEAADKSWSVRHSFEAHMRYEFLSGRDQVGRSNGELMGRRFRPEFYLCVNNCLWEIDWRLDLDGFGTQTDLQRGMIYFHGENISPWLPAVGFGMDTTNSGGGSRSRQGSGSVGAQAEYDLHSRNNGFNTGRAGQGITFTWDNRSLSGVGIPGRISRFQVGMNSYAEGDNGAQSNTDRQDFHAYLSVEPFQQIKNKWIQGFLFEYGAWFCNSDNRARENGCNRYRIQDHGDGGRQTLFDTGANSIGDGLHVAHGPGVLWAIGPYTLRAMGHFQRSEDRGGGIGGTTAGNAFVEPAVPPVAFATSAGRGKKRANSFLIGHDLFLWSPKGFLTGSASTTGSILVGTHFERVDMSCGERIRTCVNNSSTTGLPTTAINGGQFRRNRILLREWDLWYFVAPRMSIGTSILWYDASNLRNGANNAAHNLGVCNTPVTAANCRSGIGGDWVDVHLNWRYIF